jgi:hypothetical protein
MHRVLYPSELDQATRSRIEKEVGKLTKNHLVVMTEKGTVTSVLWVTLVKNVQIPARKKKLEPIWTGYM